MKKMSFPWFFILRMVELFRYVDNNVIQGSVVFLFVFSERPVRVKKLKTVCKARQQNYRDSDNIFMFRDCTRSLYMQKETAWSTTFPWLYVGYANYTKLYSTPRKSR